MTTKRQQLSYDLPSPMRVDAFIAEHFSDISRNYIQSLFKDQLITVNGKATKKGQLLAKGDIVEIAAFTHPNDRTIAPNPDIILNTVHEADHYLIIDKPAGLPTHPNDFIDTYTVANAFMARYPEAIDVGDDALRPGVVHRLDSNTSGLLILAKTKEAFTYFRSLFDQRLVKKTYLALVVGHLDKPQETMIDKALAHHPKNPRKMTVVEPGVSYRSQPKDSKTMYRTLKLFDHASLLEVRTLTGRMHQVRVHLSSLGYPLCGDRLYQTQQQAHQDKSGLLDRHFLHASEVKFPDFKSGQEVTFNSPLPVELAKRVEGGLLPGQRGL